jgi:hypothetical protein
MMVWLVNASTCMGDSLGVNGGHRRIRISASLLARGKWCRPLWRRHHCRLLLIEQQARRHAPRLSQELECVREEELPTARTMRRFSLVLDQYRIAGFGAVSRGDALLVSFSSSSASSYDPSRLSTPSHMRALCSRLRRFVRYVYASQSSSLTPPSIDRASFDFEFDTAAARSQLRDIVEYISSGRPRDRASSWSSPICSRFLIHILFTWPQKGLIVVVCFHVYKPASDHQK